MPANDTQTRGLRFSHVIFVALAFMLITLVYVWFHVNITKLNYAIAQEIQVRTHLLEETKRLKVEIETLQSPHRIEVIAGTKLNMCYPQREQVIFLDD